MIQARSAFDDLSAVLALYLRRYHSFGTEASTITLEHQRDDGGRSRSAHEVSDRALRALERALLDDMGRARCDECGTLSPADDPFEPGSGGGSWLCLDCED